MSASVTSSISGAGLLSLDINFTAPGGLQLKYIIINCNGVAVSYIVGRGRVTVDGSGRKTAEWISYLNNGRHVAHIPLSMFPNGSLTFSVSVSYVGSDWNLPAAGTDTPADIVVTNTWAQADLVTGNTIFPADAIAGPVTITFTVPPTVSSLDVPVAVAAVDDNAVTGYLVTQTATKPTAGDSRWSSTAPTIYTVAAFGTYTLYAWAKDADGNVSEPVTATVSATTAQAGIFALPSVTLQPVVSAPTLSGVQRGSFTAPAVTLRPTVSAPTLTGVQRGSFTMPSVTLTPTVTAPTLSGVSVVTGSGAFTLPAVTLRPIVTAPRLYGMTGGASIRAPSGQLLNLRRIDGTPFTILSI